MKKMIQYEIFPASAFVVLVLIVPGKLNVRLVPHSHDDVGWLKNVDQYYVGSNNSIQGACVKNVLDSVVESLSRDLNRKFVFAEMFDMKIGLLGCICGNGGWCMHDEAATYYIDMIGQTTLGHRTIKEQFNTVPLAGWQIDPFGHSAVQGYLLGAEVGFDSMHFARIDYQDRAQRTNEKSLEVIWQGSKTFGSSSQIFANAFPVHYSPPAGFHFEVNDDSVPVQDNPLLFSYNVEQRDGRVNALYSTPSLYTDAKSAADEPWPTKTDDYFPQNAYWTGFFTSRPAFKRFVRKLSGFYLAARQLEFFVGKRSNGPNTFDLGDALGIAQHHDAISGTAKQHTTDDYSKRLAIGVTEAEAVASSALSCLTKKNSGDKCEESGNTFSQCQLLNISYCPPTEKDIPQGKSLVVVAYNPLGWNRKEIVRILVNDANLVVQDFSANNVDVQYLALDNVTRNLREFYTKAYLGQSSGAAAKYWLYFQVSIPPLGWNTYFISKGAGKDLPVQQSYLWYGSSPGDSDPQASGAYIFRPNGSPPTVPLRITRGPLVDEVYQQFNEWIYQVTRLYKEKEHAEIEFTIGPIPMDDSVGKEIITRLTANMVTNKVFHTDSNGRDFLKRVRDFREDWNLTVTQPVAGNYYPINLGIYTVDKKSELSVLVDCATGGSSIKDREIELMLHRRMIYDDSKGVGKALDESVCGKHMRGTYGNYYVSINRKGEGAQWRQKTGQEVYSPLLLAFTHEKTETWKSSHLTKATAMDPGYALPLSVALITLQELNVETTLIRLAHLYAEGEDSTYSKLAKVELKKTFHRRMVCKEVKEMSLTISQVKSEMKKLSWKIGGNGEEASPVRGGPLNNSTLIVELGPMEIRTFLLKF
ncbi:Alpha-mannosidase [Hibiscus syriacus]|uniref:Alpha-mannosidase n=1 Tax=Hibiscus syriacus TaxID=106335 RepID=A0A6A2XPZ6_HIBSY|nr:Alpha-mannosidase [Hibiscus syriacus]